MGLFAAKSLINPASIPLSMAPSAITYPAFANNMAPGQNMPIPSMPQVFMNNLPFNPAIPPNFPPPNVSMPGIPPNMPMNANFNGNVPNFVNNQQF